jgi:hypothetical protein
VEEGTVAEAATMGLTVIIRADSRMAATTVAGQALRGLKGATVHLSGVRSTHKCLP